MCVFITTNLACGHRIRGPLVACPDVSTRKPRGPPHDDGRTPYCLHSQQILLNHNACCEACFAQAFLGMTQFTCHTCARNLWTMMGAYTVQMLERAVRVYGQQYNGSERGWDAPSGGWMPGNAVRRDVWIPRAAERRYSEILGERWLPEDEGSRVRRTLGFEYGGRRVWDLRAFGAASPQYSPTAYWF